MADKEKKVVFSGNSADFADILYTSAHICYYLFHFRNTLSFDLLPFKIS